MVGSQASRLTPSDRLYHDAAACRPSRDLSQMPKADVSGVGNAAPGFARHAAQHLHLLCLQ